MASRDQVEVFEQIGVTVRDEDEASAIAAQQQRAYADYVAALRAASLSVDEFADAAGLSPATIRDRIAQRTLWAFDDGLRTPVWELHEGAPLRGIDLVARRIPSRISPTAVDNMLTFPSVDLVAAGGQVNRPGFVGGSGVPWWSATVYWSPADGEAGG